MRMNTLCWVWYCYFVLTASTPTSTSPSPLCNWNISFCCRNILIRSLLQTTLCSYHKVFLFRHASSPDTATKKLTQCALILRKCREVSFIFHGWIFFLKFYLCFSLHYTHREIFTLFLQIYNFLENTVKIYNDILKLNFLSVFFFCCCSAWWWWSCSCPALSIGSDANIAAELTPVTWNILKYYSVK